MHSIELNINLIWVCLMRDPRIKVPAQTLHACDSSFRATHKSCFVCPFPLKTDLKKRVWNSKDTNPTRHFSASDMPASGFMAWSPRSLEQTDLPGRAVQHLLGPVKMGLVKHLRKMRGYVSKCRCFPFEFRSKASLLKVASKRPPRPWMCHCWICQPFLGMREAMSGV